MKPFSVLMSLYSKENPQYLDIALKSVFEQTLLPNQVVLVLDGPIGQELIQFVVKGSADNALLHIVDEDCDFSVFDNHRHHTDVVHSELTHADGVHSAHKGEFAVNDFAGIDALHAVVLADGL